MAARRKKSKGGRPKGLKQSPKAIKKIKSGMKAYWASAAGKKRRAAMSKAAGGGKKRTARAKAKSNPKLAWAKPKVTVRRGRKPGSKNKPKMAATGKAPVASRSKRRKSPMA